MKAQLKDKKRLHNDREKVEALNTHLYKLYKELLPTRSEQKMRDFLKKLVTTQIEIVEKSEIRHIGSTSQNYSHFLSDIDLLIVTDATPNVVLRKIHKHLNETNFETKVMLLHIQNARVPVLKINFVEFSVCFDISVGILNQHIELENNVIPLLVILKCVLRARGLNNSFRGGMSSHVLAAVTKHFIAQCPLLIEQNLAPFLLDFFLFFYSLEPVSITPCGKYMPGGGGFQVFVGGKSISASFKSFKVLREVFLVIFTHIVSNMNGCLDVLVPKIFFVDRYKRLEIFKKWLMAR